MDIHKPKPWHGWREFLKEYAIVVVGVLTALALEQVVEWTRREEAVANAREALREEVARNNGRFADRLARVECVDRQVAQISALLDKIAITGRTPHVEGVYKGSGRRIETGAWEAERSAQSVVHFPRWERSLYSTNYVQTENFASWRDREGDAWNQLDILEGPPKQISQKTIDELRIELIRVSRLNLLWKTVVPQALEWGRKLGIEPVKPSIANPTPCSDVRTW